MPTALRGLALAVILLCTALWPETGRGFEPVEVRKAMAAVYQGRDYQRDLPPGAGGGLDEGRQSDQEGEAGDGRRKAQRDLPFLWRLPGEWAEVLRIVVYLVVGVGALLLVYYLAMELPALRRARRQALSETMLETDPAAARAGARLQDPATLEEADRLAQAGRFAEAIHMLLLHALEVLRTRLESGLSKALTSREILRQAPMPEAALAALKALVARSELCHFGAKSADQALYSRSRESFEVFRRAWSGGGDGASLGTAEP